MTFRTTAAYLSGAIVGDLWAPNAPAGSYLQVNLRGQFERVCGGDGAVTFRDVLLLILAEKGGDFRNASFAADTVVRVERRSVEAAGRYTVHVWERQVAALADCADLVASESYTFDCLTSDDDE